MRTTIHLSVAAALVAASVTLSGAPAPANAGGGGAATAAKSPARPAVIARRVIGHSVNDHPIQAWELGDKEADVTAMFIGRQHGDEPAGETVLEALRDGSPVHGIDLWVVPRLNPDGALRNTRQNARHVDLNRNFPRKWRRTTGYYNSGPRPASEPETRAAIRFLNRVDPDYVVNIHQPLHGVDVRHAKDRAFARRLARELRLPRENLNCGGHCHGTLSQWFNYRHNGVNVTVELAGSPSWRYLHVRAPRGLIRAVGGTRG